MTDLQLLRPGEWVELALCRQVDADMFFPAIGESNADAKRTCGLCVVRDQCLTHAIAHETFGTDSVLSGIWGGMTRRERIAEARRRGQHPGRRHPRKDAA